MEEITVMLFKSNITIQLLKKMEIFHKSYKLRCKSIFIFLFK